ncbi:hypothetical protein F4554_002382 [Actinopolymorpha rutila]|uniref:Polyketide cyclase / dehydrase and lipid transport n=1 Tax=Actinopolymorpha rutila TaxID=446787 RepID=A0A852ZA11_9ACTN|nr:hypothetical protein [Actinopolymorpha rutila]
MPLVDLADDTFVVAEPARLARRLTAPEFWRACWPSVRLEPYHDRGAEGARWYVRGEFTGTAELWLEPCRDGTVVHVFLRADPARGPLAGRRLARVRREFAVAVKSAMFAVKDEMEAERTVGVGSQPLPGPAEHAAEPEPAIEPEPEPAIEPEPEPTVHSESPAEQARSAELAGDDPQVVDEPDVHVVTVVGAQDRRRVDRRDDGRPGPR